MDLSFNSEDDLDLIKEIESISDITNEPNNKNTTTQPKDTIMENIILSNNTQKTENQKSPRKKRRTPTKRNFTPKLDLEALLGPTDVSPNNDNNDFLNLSPRSENLFSTPKASPETSNASLSLLETRVINYADKTFQKLKEDLIYELKILFEENFHWQNIIYTFLMSLLSDIRNQIRFANESIDISQIEINFDLDTDSFNIHKNSIINNFSILPIIDQISELKSSITQNIKKSQINLNHEIQSRDDELETTRKNKNARLQYMEQLDKKNIQMQKKLYDLNFSLELYEKYNASVRQKFEDLEITEILHQQRIDSKSEIQQNLEQLKEEITGTNLNLENKRLLSKIKQMIDEKNELQQTSNALSSGAKSFNDFSHKSLYSISHYNSFRINQQSRNLSIPYSPQAESHIFTEKYAPNLNSNNQNEHNYSENRTDFIYTQSDMPNMLNTMGFNLKIPNYI